MTLPVQDIWKVARDERDRLRTLARWGVAYRGAEPQEPLLVNAKPPTRDYYIVQFLQGNRTTGLLLINSLTAKVGSITGIQKPTEAMFRFFRPADVPALFAGFGRGGAGDVRGPAGEDRRLDRPVAISVAKIKVETVLYWESCDQSLTPFKPFYRVAHVEPGGTEHFFVRVDGEIYTRITHGGAGM